MYQFLPPLSPDEYEALKADIAEQGVQVPVEYDEQGNILDGHHRVRACEELGIKDWPRIVRVGLTEEEKVAHILSLNLSRRHLTREQRKELVVKLRQQGWSLRRIAERLGISHMQASRDVADVTDVTPERVTGADSKQYPAHNPQRKPAVFVPSGHQHERVIEAIQETGGALPAKYVEPRRVEKLAQLAKIERVRKLTPPAVSELGDIVIHHGDFRELEVEPSSADLVFTDPPYNEIPLWSDLAAFAKRVLKPGRLLVTYTGRQFLPEVIQRLGEQLTYVWLGVIVEPGEHPKIFSYHIRSNSRPILFYANGMYEPSRWFDDTHWSRKVEKDLHEWQKPLGVAEYYVDVLTQPGDLVVDPFLGSGTTAVAAKRLGCRFIGCDVDAYAVQIARERLRADG